jgi:hypothetical protein
MGNATDFGGWPNGLTLTYMIELLLAYQLPANLAEPEFRSWLAAITRALTAISPSSTLESSGLGARSVLRLTVGTDPRCRRTHDAITELLGDMRMLGLRPEVIAASDDGSSALAGVLPRASADPLQRN